MDALFWQMPLKNQPELVLAGVATHGVVKKEESFLLPELWSLHVYSYHGRVSFDAQQVAITPGSASVIAPNVRTVFRFEGESRHIYAHFRLPAGGDSVAMPMMQELGEAWSSLSQSLEEAVGWFPSQPRRASVRLWDVLWRLAGQPMAEWDPSKRLHPALSRAVREIELHLSQVISIPLLAKKAEVSHNHLTRLFRTQFGQTVEGYIRQRRVERARHLLAETTLPVKSIAAEVGLPDLHFFNKTLRAATKLSPREYRLRWAGH